MLALLKLLQSLVKELHSDGTPTQIAFGAALGAALGLTPVANVHNIVILALLLLLDVSFGAGMLAWGLFVPLGFALDPVFDRVGHALLASRALAPLWTSWFNAPLVPYTNFNNTVVLGSVVGWIVLFTPIFFLVKWLLVRYRVTYGERVRRSRFYRAVTASQAYNVYRWFRPE